jgi:hypothetical protein
LLLSIVALVDCSCKDFAISRKVKHKEPDGGLHNPTRDFFFKVLFFLACQTAASCIKIGLAVFFAHKPLTRLDKTVPQVQKHSLIRHRQIRHSTSIHAV